MLQAIPGLGPDKADALLNHFGNIQTVISAHHDHLMRVPGIGETTAEKILDALGHAPE